MHHHDGCDAHSKKTLRLIRKKGHHYLAQVKANNRKLQKWLWFLVKVNPPLDTHTTVDHNTHGRYEYRRCDIYDDTWGIDKEWKGVKRIIRVTSGVQKSDENFCRLERHCYISSLEADAKTILHIVRKHWGIENSLHYVKDVSFNEDSCRMRTGQIPFVSTTLRSLAISFMNHHRFKNIKQMRKRFAWESELLFGLF